MSISTRCCIDRVGRERRSHGASESCVRHRRFHALFFCSCAICLDSRKRPLAEFVKTRFTVFVPTMFMFNITSKWRFWCASE